MTASTTSSSSPDHPPLPPVTIGHLAVDANPPGDTAMAAAWPVFGSTGSGRDIVSRQINSQRVALDNLRETVLAGSGALMKEVEPVVRDHLMHLALSKVDAVAKLVVEYLAELPAAHKIVVLSAYRPVLTELYALLMPYGAAMTWAGMPVSRMSGSVYRFLTHADCRVFLGQVGGLPPHANLTAAETIIFADPSWDARANAQAILNVHRAGQTKAVMAWFVSAGAADAEINRTLATRVERLISFQKSVA